MIYLYCNHLLLHFYYQQQYNLYSWSNCCFVIPLLLLDPFRDLYNMHVKPWVQFLCFWSLYSYHNSYFRRHGKFADILSNIIHITFRCFFFYIFDFIIINFCSIKNSSIFSICWYLTICFINIFTLTFTITVCNIFNIFNHFNASYFV